MKKTPFKKNSKKGKAFTLVELIVVMAVIAVLTLLASPKFMGYTKEARHTKLISNSKELEKASERYFMDHKDWPRLTDEPYSAEEVHEFAKRIYDISGKEVTLDPSGNYYDIDYEKISEYIKEPGDKMNYVLRNPVGKVYALEDITKKGIERANRVNPTDISFKTTSISLTAGKHYQTELLFTPIETTVRDVTYLSENTSIAIVSEDGIVTGISPGTTQITVLSKDNKISKSISVTVTAPFVSKDFIYKESAHIFTVPETGRYLLEAWGGQGQGMLVHTTTTPGGKGGYAKGTVSLIEGTTIYIYTGGGLGKYYNGGGRSGGEGKAGGGATHIAKRSGLLSSLSAYKDDVLIVAGGGGAGGGYETVGGAGGGLTGGNGYYDGEFSKVSYPGGGTQTTGRYGGQFGKGADAYYRSSGGGGGWYGGGRYTGGYASGGGGSSFIGNTTNGSTTSGINTGNGKAKITFLGN